jgi:hypothetical protein
MMKLPDNKIICGPLELQVYRPYFGINENCTFVFMKNISLTFINKEIDNGQFTNEEERYK